MTTSIVEGRQEKMPHYGSLRTDAPPMATGKRLADVKLLFPIDGADFPARHPCS
jgi:hypothetical protein